MLRPGISSPPQKFNNN